MITIPRVTELRRSAEIERAKASALSFWYSDPAGHESVVYPDAALSYFAVSEFLREQAFALEAGVTERQK